MRGERESKGARRRQLGVAASIVLVAIGVVLAIVGGSDGADEQSVAAPARLADVAGLIELEGSLGHSVYWAGERPPDEFELTTESDGSVYVRYLPPGTEAGDPRPTFLTVGTYPIVDARAALRRTAAENGAALEELDSGAVVLANPSSRGSVYLAYPGSDLEIEVYDPEPGGAMSLIRSGAIRPVG